MARVIDHGAGVVLKDRRPARHDLALPGVAIADRRDADAVDHQVVALPLVQVHCCVLLQERVLLAGVQLRGVAGRYLAPRHVAVAAPLEARGASRRDELSHPLIAVPAPAGLRRGAWLPQAGVQRSAEVEAGLRTTWARKARRIDLDVSGGVPHDDVRQLLRLRPEMF
eukprot:SAG31_NODE_3098_length_4678_cov_2.509282_5_plen_168_part_00